jgi:hypothetical protein
MIVDFGHITREFITEHEQDEHWNNASKCSKYCGFRLIQLRKRHGRIRIVNKLNGLNARFYYLVRTMSKRLYYFFQKWG